MGVGGGGGWGWGREGGGGRGWTQYVYHIGDDDDEVFAVEVYVGLYLI